MEAFICRQNINRYRELLEVSTDDAQRLEIMSLLADEEGKLKHLNLTEIGDRSSRRES